MRLLQSNVFWSGLEAGASAGLSFASAFIVARLIGPTEVGVGAAVVAVHVLLWVVVNALFADPLVQRLEVDDHEASSALWASVLVGVLAAFVQAAAAVPIADAMGDRRILPMGLLLALPLPLVGAGGVMQGMLTRNREYRVLAGRALIGQGGGTLAGVALALLGAGAWALVAQQLVNSLFGALSLVLRTRWRPYFMLRWQPVRELLHVGLPLVLSTLVQHSRYRLFALLIGGTAGATALGQVHMAFRLVDTVRELANTAFWRLSLPSMSERQRDLPALHATISRFLGLIGLVLFPLFGAMLVAIDPLVRLLLGPVWAPSAGASAVLIVITMYGFLYAPAGTALVARGHTRFVLGSMFCMTVLTLVGVLVVRPATPQAAVVVWAVSQLLVFPVMQFGTARLLGDSVFRQIRAGLPALGLACVAIAAALLVPRAFGEPRSPALLIAERLTAGAVVYLPGAVVLLRASVLAALRTVGMRRRPA
ncbi:MAG: oligosaccharide flippase family protein [Rhodospirillales bacterium]|nr:oligosaccharide flippase family protein [Rhodospirillales bacterium]